MAEEAAEMALGWKGCNIIPLLALHGHVLPVPEVWLLRKGLRLAPAWKQYSSLYTQSRKELEAKILRSGLWNLDGKGSLRWDSLWPGMGLDAMSHTGPGKARELCAD